MAILVQQERLSRRESFGMSWGAMTQGSWTTWGKKRKRDWGVKGAAKKTLHNAAKETQTMGGRGERRSGL